MCTNTTKNMTGAIDNLYPMGQCYQDSEFKGATGHAGPIGKNYYHDWLMASAKYGIRFANTHMSGDRSNNQFIKTIAEAQAKYGPASTKNWASDHCVLVNPADLPQAGKLGVLFSCYSNPIGNGAEIARDYGDKVAETYISPVKSMIAAGIHPAYEQENSAVWQGLSLFMTRKDREGKVWGPQERLDHPSALKMTTIWAAEYILKPDKLGSIEKGKLADMAVLDKDYLTISDEDVAKIQPQLTVFDGQIVYIHKNFQQEYNLKVPGAVISTYQDLIKRRNGQAGNGG
jgi:predicted amidohydrolase YtcJ